MVRRFEPGLLKQSPFLVLNAFIMMLVFWSFRRQKPYRKQRLKVKMKSTIFITCVLRRLVFVIQIQHCSYALIQYETTHSKRITHKSIGVCFLLCPFYICNDNGGLTQRGERAKNKPLLGYGSNHWIEPFHSPSYHYLKTKSITFIKLLEYTLVHYSFFTNKEIKLHYKSIQKTTRTPNPKRSHVWRRPMTILAWYVFTYTMNTFTLTPRRWHHTAPHSFLQTFCGSRYTRYHLWYPRRMRVKRLVFLLALSSMNLCWQVICDVKGHVPNHI